MGHRVVWLGAGFSYNVTRGDIPLMSGFFDRLTAREHPALGRFVRAFGDADVAANIEDVICAVDEREDCPFSGRLRAAIGASHDFAAVRRDLHSYCLKRLCCGSLADESWAAELLRSQARDATVITTNYDNVAERILSNVEGNLHLRTHPTSPSCPHCIMRSILEFGCGCGRAGTRRPRWMNGLVKLHGSVAWHVCKNAQCQALDCLVPEAHCRPFHDQRCRCCGGATEPVLVMPTKQKRYAAFPKLERMWDAAFEALTQADEVLIFGFSFAASDSIISLTFEKALAQGTGPLHIWVADIDPVPIADRIQSLMPVERDVAIETLLIPRDFSEPAWWVEEKETARLRGGLRSAAS